MTGVEGAALTSIVHAGPFVEGEPVLDTRPPGDRYYRHPGDVVRLVLWGAASVVLIVLIWLATSTMRGVTTDLGRAAAHVQPSLRELVLALVQVAAVGVPVVVIGLLVAHQRWRRLGTVLLAAGGGAALFALVDVRLDLPAGVPDAVEGGTWFAAATFPSLPYIAGLGAAALIGKPWLSRPWRRATDISLALLVLAIAVAGTRGLAALLLALTLGATVGAAILAVLGAPNRRPSPAAVAHGLRTSGLDVTGLTLERAEGGRSQLYTVTTRGGATVFTKVYARDSRDADLLYRGYRTLLFRGPTDDWPALSLRDDVEHEAFLLLLARQNDVTCPRVQTLTRLDDGSMALALEYVAGTRLDRLAPEMIDAGLLDALWREVQAMHETRLAHRALRAANILVADGRPVIIDFGFSVESAPPRTQAIDRAELLVSLAELVGVSPAVEAAAAVLTPADLGAALPYLQPLALSSATRRAASKSLLQALRTAVAAATGATVEPPAQLVRVRARTLVTIAASVGAFYVLLPQLAHVGDSFVALRSANWAWLAASLVLSGLTYVAAGVCTVSSVPEPLPFVPTVLTQLASSFVNRVTPANVGGMALNVRYMQKAGVEPAEAVTGVGLNTFAGALAHIGLLVIFFTWAGRNSSSAFSIPSESKLLVAIAVLLALAGLLVATRRGRKLVRTKVVGFVRTSVRSLVALARAPGRLAALFGGSAALTLAYVASLAAAVAAFDGHASFAQIGAVYLGASLLAAAAPTPGGLGALEAALVAGFTGVGMTSGVAVAAVLSYRLVTYWIPVLPGWVSLKVLERRGLV
jgi:undecaprenyl-diphosphatase